MSLKLGGKAPGPVSQPVTRAAGQDAQAAGRLLLTFAPRPLTREPISASCDASTFPTRSWIETFSSFCTSRGT